MYVAYPVVVGEGTSQEEAILVLLDSVADFGGGGDGRSLALSPSLVGNVGDRDRVPHPRQKLLVRNEVDILVRLNPVEELDVL